MTPRSIITGALVAVFILSSLSVAPVSAHGSKHWWTYSYPFASSADHAMFYMTTRGKPRRLDLPTGAGSAYQLRGLKWKGWSSDRAVATGRARYCGDSCRGWRKVKIVLGSRQRIDCAHGVGTNHDYHLVYRKSKVIRGLDFVPKRTKYTVPKGVTRCS